MLNTTDETQTVVQDPKITSTTTTVDTIIEPKILIDTRLSPPAVCGDFLLSDDERSILKYLVEHEGIDVPIFDIKKNLGMSKSKAAKARRRLANYGAILQYRKAPYCHHMFAKLNPNAVVEESK